VDRYPDGASPYGVYDLVGNVWEWTDTWYDSAGDLKVVKGGCHALTKAHVAATGRDFNAPWIANRLTGFRTALAL
jgi:formylglycine-generating enzyme required for sulfatase activity